MTYKFKNAPVWLKTIHVPVLSTFYPRTYITIWWVKSCGTFPLASVIPDSLGQVRLPDIVHYAEVKKMLEQRAGLLVDVR